jgi:hypothetical protein
MAKSKNNVVTHGLSGKIGNMLVFSQRAGKTVVSTLSHVKHEPTELQKQHQRRFQQAILYGKASIADADMKEAYRLSAEPGQSAFNVAVADFFNAPDIEHIDLSRYTGNVGDKISVRASDDFAVGEVVVRITNADGSLVEEGAAKPDATGYEWTYTATQPNQNLEGDRIEVLAFDTPGNVAREEHVL